MFKQLTCIILLLALVGSSFSRYIIIAGFQMNREYIADKLCENKKKPVLKCKGKCFLAKKLKQAEEEEKSPTDKNSLKNPEIGILQSSVQSIIYDPVCQLSLNSLPIYHFQYSSRHIESIFRPPRTV